MIIKFKSDKIWVVFGEVDHVEYNDIDFDPKKDAARSDVIVYEPPSGQAVTGKCVGLGFFTKNMSEATEVIAYSPIYLMNDHGQTVETI